MQFYYRLGIVILVIAILIISGCVGALKEKKKISNMKKLQFSVDDIIYLFLDITLNKDVYDSVFENEMLGLFKRLHDKTGFVVTLNCYNQGYDFQLRECTDKFRKEFMDNSDWLKFAFHAYDADSYTCMDAEQLSKDYEEVERELERITGRSKVEWLRLDRFCGTKEQIIRLHEKYNISTFFTSDDRNKESYYLDEGQRRRLYLEDGLEEDGVFFTPTDMRLDNITCDEDLDKLLKEHEEEKLLVVFTHEWKMREVDLSEWIEKIAEYGKEHNYMFL